MSALNVLNAEEQALFAGLLYTVICADGKFSEEEAQAIVEIAEQVKLPGGTASEGTPMSADELFGLINQMAPRVDEKGWLDKALKQVTRAEAREAIYELLRKLADADAIVDAEWAILDRITHAWELEVNSAGALLR